MDRYEKTMETAILLEKNNILTLHNCNPFFLQNDIETWILELFDFLFIDYWKLFDDQTIYVVKNYAVVIRA